MTEAEVPPLFASPAALREGFHRGLEDMLEHDLLGVFILVLANASYEQTGFARLRDILKGLFARWDERFRMRDPVLANAAPDDVAVFRRLQDLGFERVRVTRRRDLGDWQLQYNQLRAFRPARMSGATVARLRRPFDPGGFHFDKPFLRREVLWEGCLAGRDLRLLYNKFPFADYHGLLVPEPAAGRPQYLEPEDHAHAWASCTLLGRSLPGFGLGYNAYGAGASVNHLHFQTFMRTAGDYPVEAARWQHNGGREVYPLAVQRLTERSGAWSAIDRCQREQQAFNLLYRPGRLYLVRRAIQGRVEPSDWAGGLAWTEAAGVITVFDEPVFRGLEAAQVAAELARMRAGQSPPDSGADVDIVAE